MRKKGIRDLKQKEVWTSNHEKIKRLIDKIGKITVSDLAIKSGLSRKTVYKHIKILANKKLVLRHGRFYCTSLEFLKEKIEQEDLAFRRSVKALDMLKERRRISLEIIDESAKTTPKDPLAPYRPHPGISEERTLWVLGTSAKIWCSSLSNEDLDEEVLAAVRNLIVTLLKKADIKKLTDSKLAVQISFDLPTTIQSIMEYHRVMVPKVFLAASELAARRQLVWTTTEKEFLEMIADSYVEAARRIIYAAKRS